MGNATPAIALYATVGLWLALAELCESGTLVVTNDADSGPGTLREAIVQANMTGGGTI